MEHEAALAIQPGDGQARPEGWREVLSAASSLAPARDRTAEIIVHSEAVAHVLGVPPHWLARWGSTAMAGVVGLLVALAWLVHYPDKVPASVVVTMPVPPATVVAQASGHLETLTVRDAESVQEGAILARIQSTVDPGAAARLTATLAAWHDDAPPPDADVSALAALPLGELQGDCAALARAHAAYAWHLTADPFHVQIRALATQRAPLQERIAGLQRQRTLLTAEVATAERGYGRTLQLARKQDASLLTLDDRERTVLAAKRALEGSAIEQANTQLELDRLDQSITELAVRDRQQRQDLLIALQQAVKTMSGRLASWERTYVLRAPIAGRVSLSHYWTDSQFVRAGEEVMAVVPAGAQPPVGRASLPVARAGSVRVGQAVFIRLDNYPSEQFGMLKGQVETIAPVPLAARYAVKIVLPNELETTFGHRLEYQQEMQGQAEIVVEDLRIIDRIFYQFRRTFRQR